MKKLNFLVVMMFMMITYSCQDHLGSDLNNENISVTLRDGSTHDICFMSWNSWLLDTVDPLGIDLGPQCEGQECLDRAQRICDLIVSEDPDIVNIQEVFVNDAADVLIACLEANGYYVSFDDSNNNSNIFGADLGSGLLTASKFPINQSEIIEYDEETGLTNSGQDGAADKGFLVTTIELEPGCFITNINTHIDAGEDPASQCARIQQMMQLASFVDNIDSSIPVIIGGDFNIDANGSTNLTFGVNSHCIDLLQNPLFSNQNFGLSEIDILAGIMGSSPTHIVSGNQLDPTSSGGQVLDYFIISNMDGNISNVVTSNVEFNCETKWVVEASIEVIWVALKFDTEQEALDFMASCIYSCTYIGPTEFCDAHPSDHNPVKTCLTYDCDDQVDMNSNVDPPIDGPPNIGCYPKCPPGSTCLKGECVPF